MAQLGSALRSGRRGRGFKSRYPDHLEQVGDLHFSEVWIASLFFYAHPVTRLGLSDKKCVRSVCRRVGPFYLMGPFRIPMLCWYSVGIALS